jgi:hypothetical protein
MRFQVTCIGFFCLSHIASAAETWSCVYHPWVDVSRAVHAQIRLDGSKAEYSDDLYPGITTKPLMLNIVTHSERGFVAISAFDDVGQQGPVWSSQDFVDTLKRREEQAGGSTDVPSIQPLVHSSYL